MTDLAHRYGTPSPVRRRALIALVVIVAAAGLTWLAWAAIYQSTPQVRSELDGFEIVDDHSATGVLTVIRDDQDTRATCFVRALADDHSIVGEDTIAVDTGALRQQVDVAVRTERRATTVESLGCTAPGQTQRK